MTQHIDLELIKEIVKCIPDSTWDTVCKKLVPAIVDDMPGSVLEQLTGTYDNFDLAEEILLDYYTPLYRKHDLIFDSFKLIGPQITVDILDALKLNQLQPEPTNEMPIV